MKKNLLFISTILFLHSCTDLEKTRFQSVLKEIQIPFEIEYVLILEQSGCSVCLYKANSFFEENRENERILFLFSGFISSKNVRLKYKLSGNEANIRLDTESVLLKNKSQIEYPSIFYLKNGEIKNYEIANTSNFDSYQRLKLELSKVSSNKTLPNQERDSSPL